jgi:hypothetical protein
MFLIDAAGAFVSIILLALVLPSFESVIGMPYRVLYLLAAFAAPLFVFSSLCWLFARERWRMLLNMVAVGNLLYCLISIAAIFWFKGDLTTLGIVYFVGEVIVISSLASIELIYSASR